MTQPKTTTTTTSSSSNSRNRSSSSSTTKGGVGSRPSSSTRSSSSSSSSKNTTGPTTGTTNTVVMSHPTGPNATSSFHPPKSHHHRTTTTTTAASTSTSSTTSNKNSTTSPPNSGDGRMLIRQWLYEIELQDCDTEWVWETLCGSYSVDSPTSFVALFHPQSRLTNGTKYDAAEDDHDTTTTRRQQQQQDIFTNIITSAADQRKLHLLVQRIQLLLQQQKTLKQQVATTTLSPRNGTTNVTVNTTIPKENCHPSSTSHGSSTGSSGTTRTASTTTTAAIAATTSTTLSSKEAPTQKNNKNKLVKSASQLLDDVLSGTTSSAHTNHHTTRSSSSSSTSRRPSGSTSISSVTTGGTIPKNSSLPQPKLRSSSVSTSTGSGTCTTTSNSIVTPRASRPTQPSSLSSSSFSHTTTTAAVGISLRTGKQLSSIPSEHVLPMSPFLNCDTNNSSNHPNDDWMTATDQVTSATTNSLPPNHHRRRSLSHDDSTMDHKCDSNAILSNRQNDNHSVRTLNSNSRSHPNRRTTLADKLGHQSERHLTSFVVSSSNASVSSAATTKTTSHRRQSVLPDRNNTNPSRSKSRLSYHPSSTVSLSGHGNNTGNNLNSSNSNNGNLLMNSSNTSSQVTTIMNSISSNSNVSFKFQIEALREETTQDHEANGITTNDAANNMSDDEMRIRVIVRKRPMTTSESNINAGDIDIIHPLQYDQYGRILVYQPKTRVDLTKQIEIVPFAFDNVYDDHSTNQQIYESSIRNLIPSFFVGQWASIFAYGQTGSGKTFTMMGNNFTGMNCTTPANVDLSNLGLYYMAALDIFHALQSPEYESYTIHVSLFEIYGGKLFDLLNGRFAVKCLEDSKGNVCFPGLSDHPVHNANELMNLIVEGATLRSTGTTSRNADSSRSHAVLQLHLYRKATTISRRRGTTTTTICSSTSRNGKEEFSRLTFIDLAGSERGADTSTASRATRLEGAEINTSLLALKEVIRALATGDSLTHVPFRGSKLTQVLKQSFVGKNCRSVMIACISPNIGNCEQTLNTLRYADRVKERNPETGELSPTMIASTTTKALTPTKHALSRMPSSFTDQSYSSQKSDMLDELLASPPSTSDHDADDDDIDELLDENVPVSMAKIDPPPSVLRELIATHKDATEGMLEMIQEEMSLITVDNTNAQQFDQYLDRVYALQEEQLSMITMLRELLSQYRSMNQPSHANMRLNAATFSNPLDDVDDDDNFEDLRD